MRQGGLCDEGREELELVVANAEDLKPPQPIDPPRQLGDLVICQQQLLYINIIKTILKNEEKTSRESIASEKRKATAIREKERT